MPREREFEFVECIHQCIFVNKCFECNHRWLPSAAQPLFAHFVVVGLPPHDDYHGHAFVPDFGDAQIGRRKGLEKYLKIK